ncbi:MAG: hypothetical protein M3131_10615, partial [Actinomycetota bacterium]|nr:hypothetical protein [Actinomycetota bacterium]
MIAVGFEVAAAEGGKAAVRPFAESPALAERHLRTWSDERFDAVVIGRLHHRAEHLRWLTTRTRPGGDEVHSENDAALVASLLAHGGAQRIGRLEGDFALAVVDREHRRLVALRDPLGAYPLFWARTAGGPAVSTSIRPLTDRLPRVEPDSEFMADFLAFPIDSVAELPTTRTAYAGVQRLGPGSLLEADLATGAVCTKAQWDWEREIAPVSVESLEEAGALVRARLEEAVAE